MASACGRLAQRSSLTFIKSAIKSNVRTPASSGSATIRRSFLTRVAPELGCLQSMLPLHSTIASARMTSCLSTTFRSCRALSQELGQSVPR